AVSAIALDLSDERLPKSAARPRPPEPAGGLPDRAEARSPENAACELEALVADPAFALAFHCIEARVRPRILALTKDLPSLWRIPEAAWVGLLHASIPGEPGSPRGSRSRSSCACSARNGRRRQPRPAKPRCPSSMPGLATPGPQPIPAAP